MSGSSSDAYLRLRLLGAAAFSTDARRAAAALRVLEGGADGADRSLSRMSVASAGAQRGLRAVGRTSSTIIGGLTRVGAVAGLAVAGGMYAAGKQTVAFDEAMRNVNSIAGLAPAALKRLSTSVRELGGKTAQQPVTLAKGLYDLESSGFNANQSLLILRSTAKAASAGLTDTGTSTAAVAAVLNAYHLSAKKAADVSDTLFQTVNRGVVSFPDLASTIGDVLPFAASLHVNLRQVGAAVSTLTKEGISAPETMTRLKSVMEAFIKPGTAMEKALKKIGLSGESLVAKRGLQGALEAIIKTTDGSKTALGKMFPNIRALGGALALTGANARTAHEDLKGFSNVKGLTDQVLAEQSKSVAYQWRKMKAEASSLGIAVGSKLVPAAVKGMKALNGLLAPGGGGSHLLKSTINPFLSGLRGKTTPVVTHGLGQSHERIAPLGGAAGLGARLRGDAQSALAYMKGTVLPGVKGVAQQLLAAFAPAMPFVRNILLPLLKGIAIGVLGGVVGAFKVAVPIIKLIATALGWIGKVAKPLRPVFQGLGVVIGVVFGSAILKALATVGKVGVVFRLLAIPLRVTNGLFRGGAAILGRLIAPLGRMSGLMRGVGGAAKTMGGFILKGFKIWAKAHLEVIKLLGRLPRFALSIGGKLVSALANGVRGRLGALGSFFGRVGKVILSAIVKAIKAAPGAIVGALSSVVPGPAKKLLHKIPGFAAGGTVHTNGAILVGEQGPELLEGVGGARIHTAARTRQMMRKPALMAAGGVHVHLHPSTVVQQNDRGTWAATHRVERHQVETG